MAIDYEVLKDILRNELKERSAAFSYNKNGVKLQYFPNRIRNYTPSLALFSIKDIQLHFDFNSSYIILQNHTIEAHKILHTDILSTEQSPELEFQLSTMYSTDVIQGMFLAKLICELSTNKTFLEYDKEVNPNGYK